jgi:lysozyme
MSAVEIVKKWEGCRLRAYRDGGGVLTIGYGHTQGVTDGLQWTQDQADEALIHDLKSAEAAVLKHITVLGLKPNQLAALTSFVFNLGETQFAKSTLLAEVNQGNDIGAALQIIKWHNDNGKPVKGLLRRRLDEAALYLT